MDSLPLAPPSECHPNVGEVFTCLPRQAFIYLVSRPVVQFPNATWCSSFIKFSLFWAKNEKNDDVIFHEVKCIQFFKFQNCHSNIFMLKHPLVYEISFWRFVDVDHFKSLLSLLQYCCCFMSCVFGPKACGISGPWPGIEPTPPAS